MKRLKTHLMRELSKRSHSFLLSLFDDSVRRLSASLNAFTFDSISSVEYLFQN